MADYLVINQAPILGTAGSGSSGDVTFQVINQSTLYTAASVIVSITGANSNDLLISLDGQEFAATVELGDMVPGAISPVIYLRRVTPAAQATGLKSAEIQLTTTSWSY